MKRPKISNREVLKMLKQTKKAKNLPHLTGKWLYFCGNDPLDIHLDDPHPKRCYSSVKALKADKECWKECGIIKVKLTYYTVSKGSRRK